MVADDFITVQRTYLSSLSSLCKDGIKVAKLSINGIHFGDEKGFSKLELSTDREYLFIFTEDEYVSVAKMLTKDIQIIKFMIDDDEFQLYY